VAGGSVAPAALAVVVDRTPRHREDDRRRQQHDD
jgi:hypothetical protein